MGIRQGKFICIAYYHTQRSFNVHSSGKTRQVYLYRTIQTQGDDSKCFAGARKHIGNNR